MAKTKTRFFDFEAGVSLGDALDTAEAALDDEGLSLLRGAHVTHARPKMIRVRDYGRLIDRLVVPGSLILARSV